MLISQPSVEHNIIRCHLQIYRTFTCTAQISLLRMRAALSVATLQEPCKPQCSIVVKFYSIVSCPDPALHDYIRYPGKGLVTSPIYTKRQDSNPNDNTPIPKRQHSNPNAIALVSKRQHSNPKGGIAFQIVLQRGGGHGWHS